ncbi:MAG: hypothetical protein OEW59_03675, partial [Gammaproteobacteria bacterium]|nr:hypothetical protein [Gammaproteobacteria bacterium]
TLVRAGLADPVLDTDRLRLTFGRTAALASDLVACGASPGTPERLLKDLIGGSADREWSLGLELVYGHAWGVGVRTAPGEFRVEAGSIARRERP